MFLRLFLLGCALGHISGAHFNLAVTLSFAVMGRFPWKEVPGYVFGQCLASISACSVLGIVLGQIGQFGATVPDISVPSALVLEVILSFVLMCVIAGVATDSRASGEHAGCAIGGAVMFCALMGGPLSVASMNPARTLGPAVFSGDLSFLWLYTLGPICGASLGSVVYQWIRCGGEPLDANGCCKDVQRIPVDGPVV